MTITPEFIKLAPQFYHIHLATHGFFAPIQKKSTFSSELFTSNANALRHGFYGDQVRSINVFSPHLLSGLAFAGANNKPQENKDDGILTAEEIAFLPLEGVELVTLSACEMGLGEIAGGEGLLGVQRAFQVSGAGSTIASFWKVDDLVTRQMMEGFYHNLWKKKLNKLDALRETQLWILNNPNKFRGASFGDTTKESAELKMLRKTRTHPKLWASFQISGDWR